MNFLAGPNKKRVLTYFKKKKNILYTAVARYIFVNERKDDNHRRILDEVNERIASIFDTKVLQR